MKPVTIGIRMDAYDEAALRLTCVRAILSCMQAVYVGGEVQNDSIMSDAMCGITLLVADAHDLLKRGTA